MNRTFIHKYLWWTYRPLKNRIRKIQKRRHLDTEMERVQGEFSQLSNDRHHVFYLGITENNNLGDNAQHYCILNWINENYGGSQLVRVEATSVLDKKHDFLGLLKGAYRKGDLILFQSGYTTQDLGGNHEEMHRYIIDNMPYANILMMPQTIYFREEANKKRTADSYDKATNMLFLARDFVSYEMAKEMFPNVRVETFPDIVTTLIGKYDFSNVERNGISFCIRNDEEKFYSVNQVDRLKREISKFDKIEMFDTTINVSNAKIRQNLRKYIEWQIERFSHYKINITDRYHGTILSLAAGTPVIIIKSTDHKVTTGAQWFSGVYDEYVYVAEDLDDAYRIYKDLKRKSFTHKLKPYFMDNYYSKLKQLFLETIK